MTTPVGILLVDDEARNLDVLESILSFPAYKLLRAQDADTALRLLLENEVAAVVLDIKMPGVSGVELAQMIKNTKRFRETPIVFLTAYLVEDQDVIAGYGAGAVDYLTKPVNPQILRQKIAVFAELFRKSRALVELNERLEQRVKERTSELERSEAALRAAAHQKDEFLAILAHELRNPLAPLRTGVDFLLRQLPEAAPSVGRTLAVMNRQLDHMVRLIDDLLDIARISRGSLELKKARVDLGSVVEAALDNGKPFVERKRHAIETEIAPGLIADVDPTRVVQVLSNLLHNAAKFTPEGGRIRVELTADGGRAVFRITDTGVGIPHDQIGRAFDMFARIERTDVPAEAGLGIGLALGRRLAEMHGGALEATSEGVGKGTTFAFSLPIADAAASAGSTERQVNASATAATLTVLLIEDNEDVAEIMGAWLEQVGHRVVVAHDGSSVVQMVEQAKPHVVLCDLGLPGLDGLEVCRAVRAMAAARQPVMVALTGWGREDDRRRTKDAGFDHHFVKPVALDQLSALLADCAARVGAR